MIDIKGYEGEYAITSCGRVWSYKSKKFLSFNDNGHGYKSVHLSHNNKQKRFYIHRLVAEAYISNPNGLSEVDHIDRDLSHNWVNNLRWTNYIDNGRNKSTEAYKQVINIETGEIFETRAAAARKYNVSKTAINNAIKRKGTCCGYHWRDAE